MVLFFGEVQKLAIPANRIYKIELVGKTITAYFDSGDITWLNDTIATKQLSSVSAVFDSEELATQNFRDYFAACEKNKGAFYFG